jgi:pimeloyl-ACP methyl ester carboxylesterase
MVFSLAMPVFAADEEYPVIYLKGFGGALYSDDKESAETEIYPLEFDIKGILSENLGDILSELPGGFITGNWDVYSDKIYDAVAPIFAEIMLDKNGEASNGSGDAEDMTTIPVSNKTSGYEIGDYYFHYDWRLSPMLIADELKDYIERVKAATGKDKVSLVGRCLGGNVLTAYLTKHTSHAEANVDSVVLFNVGSLGMDFFGELFSGKVVFDADEVDKFADYAFDHWELFDDPSTSELVTNLVSFLNEIKMLGISLDLFEQAVYNIKDNILPRTLRASFGTFPSFWSMVPAEYYEAAKKYVFGGMEEEYKGLIQKTDDYCYHSQLKLEDTLKYLKSKGVGIGVISKYNIPNLPLYESAAQQGDLFADTYHGSFGATCAPYGKVLPKEYIDSLKDKRYLSADHVIDASTCLFPDKTWFIKDLNHNYFPDSIDPLIMKFVRSHGEMTVFDDPQWPQYVTCNPETYEITPGVTPDEPEAEFGTTERLWIKFLRFFTNLINFLTKLFNK